MGSGKSLDRSFFDANNLSHNEEYVKMKNGQCPRCGAKEIYSGADIPLKSGPFAGNAIPISLTSMAALDNYVCVSCGLVESYIEDPAKLMDVADRWKKITPGNGSEE
jgi:predicted RNA-binding Zn-ribbon protein involved in translation (DUF1610 family)